VHLYGYYVNLKLKDTYNIAKFLKKLLMFCSKDQGWEFSSNSKLVIRFLWHGAGNRECEHELGVTISLNNL